MVLGGRPPGRVGHCQEAFSFNHTNPPDGGFCDSCIPRKTSPGGNRICFILGVDHRPEDIGMNNAEAKSVPPRPPFWIRLSVPAGTLLQAAGVILGAWLMTVGAHLPVAASLRLALMLLGWLLIYICCHSLGHWLVGTLVGIHFRGYGVRGTDHPDELSPILRFVLTRLPMFTAITDRDSMRNAR